MLSDAQTCRLAAFAFETVQDPDNLTTLREFRVAVEPSLGLPESSIRGDRLDNRRRLLLLLNAGLLARSGGWIYCLTEAGRLVLSVADAIEAAVESSNVND